MKKIVISTGGTGGHVIPAQVLYDYLSDKNKIFICTDKRGFTYLVIKIYNIKQIDLPKFSRYILLFVPFLIS